MEPKVTSHITKGVVIALVLIVLDIVAHITGLLFKEWYGYTMLIIVPCIFIWPPIQYGKELDNNATFGSLFAHGFKTTAVYTCITFVYTVLAVYVLFPGYVDQLIQFQLQKAAAAGKEVPTPSAEGMQVAKKISTVVILAGALLGGLLIGVIGSLIGAAIAKKQPRDPFGNQPI